MSRSVYRYNVSLCYLYVSLTVSVVSVKRQEVTETAKSVTETSRTYRNFTKAVLYIDSQSTMFTTRLRSPLQLSDKMFIINNKA